ncbi:coiled-coil domain-containing protein [Paracoccus yeei]|uniref:Bacteriophage tail tape measure N-terminal domain-containing protein n=1 Tax=Paracoccus yeei TaxID=147645 RepID=A0A5P2QS44_9RHOB|nr:hypothetical protein [Paracoccus yeei]QEU08229.1 hypothetical protein FOB51_09565 [Paracoccus yeei]
MAQEPDLLISAGFSAAQVAKEADKLVALYRDRGEQAGKAFKDATGKVTDAEGLRAHMRELDNLAKKYDPVYRATKQYEAEVKRLDQALKVGAVTQAQYSQRLQEAQVKLTQAGKATADVAAKTGGGLRGNIQNISFQLQDFAVQVAAGTSASTALGQQLPQLLGGFGALGSVLGAVVAVGVPLAAMFLSTGDAAEDLKKSMDALEKAVQAYDAAAKNSGETAADLASKFGAATAQAQDLYDRIARLQYLDAVSAVGKAIGDLSKNFGDLQSYLNVIDSEIAQFGSASPVTLENIGAQLKEDFGLTVDQAREFVRLLSDAQAASSIQEKAARLNDIAVYLDNAVRSTGDANDKMRDLARSAAEGALQSYELAKSSDDLSLSMQEASDAASTVAASVAGIDFSNAVAGANQLVAALQSGMAAIAALEGQQAIATRRAQIARDFAGDKVGAAGATGALDFNQSYDAANPYQGPLTREMQADIDARRDAYVEGEKELARIQEETQARLKAISEAGRGGGGGRKKAGGGGRSGGAAKEPVDIFETAEREIQQLERQITVLGKSSEETARLQAQWAMLDAAKKAGIPINDQLNAQIAAQAEQVGSLTGELEQAKIAQDQFDQAIEGVANAFSNAILSGESLRDSLAQIFRQIAANILNAGIQEALTSAFSGMGGGGGFWGGLLSAAFGGTKAAVPTFGGARANGGPVTAGQMYLTGERGPEPFVPAVNGRILSVAQAQAALRSGQGAGASVSFNPTINVGGNVTQDDIARIHQVMEVERKNFIQNVRRAQAEIGQRYN